MRRNSWPLIGLGALALVTVVLVALSFFQVRPQTVEAVPDANGATNSPVMPEEPTPPGAPTATPTATATPSPTPSARAPRASTVGNIQELLRGKERVKIVVLGDSTGLDNGETGEFRWVTLWARDLSVSRPVTVVTRQDDGTFVEPRRYGTGPGAPIEIYNASNQPKRMPEAIAQAEALIPADTDLVMINFGHNEVPADMARNLDALWAKLPIGAMGLVIAQNPQSGAGVRDQQLRTAAVLEWAKRRKAPSVDVFAAFVRAPEPLDELLIADRVNPSPSGSEVWKDAVVAALR